MDLNASSSAIPRGQPSIRSFFRPKNPNYVPPPVPLSSQSSASHLLPSDSRSVPNTTPQGQNLLPQPTSNLTGDPALPPQANISPVQQDHIQPLRRINSLLLPIAYPDSFYHKILEPSPVNFSRVILWTDPHSKDTKVVGGIVCRLDPSLAPGSTPQSPQILEGSYDIYIQSLVLLSPYREKGLAAAALKSVIDAAIRQDRIRIRELYAHVWTENMEALEWYPARGFKRDELVLNGYYKRLKPDTAWIFRRKLVPSDHLSHPSVTQPISPPAPPTLAKAASAPPRPTVPPSATNPRPDNIPHTKSFQDRRPDREWNDLPEDVLGNPLLKPPSLKSGDGSAASSRSSSKNGVEGKGKKKGRAYPAAAFGS